MVVVIIVDGQQVAVHVGIPHQQLYIGDAMNMLQEAVELIKATWLRPIQREPTKLRTKLGWRRQAHPHKHNCKNTLGAQGSNCLQCMQEISSNITSKGLERIYGFEW